MTSQEHATVAAKAIVTGVNATAAGVAVAAWVQLLPPTAALFSIGWILYQLIMDIRDRAERRRREATDRRIGERRCNQIPVDVERRGNQ